MLRGLPDEATPPVKDTHPLASPPSAESQSPAPQPSAPQASAPPSSASPSARQEIAVAREIRAMGLVAGLGNARIAEDIHDQCGPIAGTSRIRAYRLALGVSLADLVAQVRAWYASEGRAAPRFSETLLSAYESGQKRPGPEYLHYLCAVYRAEPPDLGYPSQCFCGRPHRSGPVPPPGLAPGQTVGEGGDITGGIPRGHGPQSAQPGSATPAPMARPEEGPDVQPDPREAEDDDDV